jgi:hypothetical protein
MPGVLRSRTHVVCGGGVEPQGRNSVVNLMTFGYYIGTKQKWRPT